MFKGCMGAEADGVRRSVEGDVQFHHGGGGVSVLSGDGLRKENIDMKEIDEAYGDYKKHRWSFGAKLIGFILFVAVILAIGKLVLFPMKVATTVIESTEGVISKTLDSDNVLYNYEWFKQVYRDIKATDNKIVNIESEKNDFMTSAGDRNGWSFEDKNEYSRLSSTLTGLKNYRQDQVAQYNARSKMLNRKLFKGWDLPPEIQE